MIAIDLSNWAVGPTQAQVASFIAIGVSRAIVGTSFWQRQSDGTYRYVGDEQMAAFESAGVETLEYMFPYREHSTERRWFTDMENSTATLDSARHALQNGAEGPYSRASWAAENLPGWDCKGEFPHSRLWTARYVHRDDVSCLIQQAIDTGGDIAAAIATELSWLTPFVSYWGFTEDDVEMTQWHNSITIFGVNVDLNAYKGDEMTAAERAEFDALKLVVLKSRIDLQDLANGEEAIQHLNGWTKTLRAAWYAAGKVWPF